jgi:Arc/MetJ family transcription regulator
MASNLHIDQKLLERAVRLGGRKTKRETVNDALLEYVRHREQMKIVNLFGAIDYDGKLDYKAQRRRDAGARRLRGNK